MPLYKDIIDVPQPTSKPTIRPPFIWILDSLLLTYTVVLFTGTFVLLSYHIYDDRRFVLSAVGIVISALFLTSFGTSFLLFLYRWYRLSTKYDRTRDKGLLVHFLSESKFTLIPSSGSTKTLAELVQESSSMIFILSAILLFIASQRHEMGSLFSIVLIGFIVYAILSIGYCLVINRWLRNFLQKHTKS